MIDHGYDLGVHQRQYTTGSQQFAPPVQREPVSATSQELIISARGVDPQNVATQDDYSPDPRLRRRKCDFGQ